MNNNIRLAAVNAVKNNDGQLVAPDASKITADKLNSMATADDPFTLTVKGYAGENYPVGSLFFGNFDVDKGAFVGTPALIPSTTAITLPGNSSIKNSGVTVNANGKVTENHNK